MIRVFLLAMLALAALVMVSGYLPYRTAPPVSPEDSVEAEPPSSGPFSRWDGVWEGSMITRRADGTIVESRRRRQEHTTISPIEHKIDLTDDQGGRRAVVTWRADAEAGDRLECRVTDPVGGTMMLQGSRAGAALLWHRRDPAGGREEIYREEIVRLSDGDLYKIDGVRIDPRGETLVVEGRLRRAESRPK